jgi:hypothetical protein
MSQVGGGVPNFQVGELESTADDRRISRYICFVEFIFVIGRSKVS